MIVITIVLTDGNSPCIHACMHDSDLANSCRRGMRHPQLYLAYFVMHAGPMLHTYSCYKWPSRITDSDIM